MCGICGSIRLCGPTTPEDDRVVRAMMRSLEHRGPDGQGIWSDDEAVLGHLRLAIIDLAGGYQPLLNETGRIGVVFNGEIYNYRELRDQLRAAGHRFRTESDTEVLVHGYEEWGDALPERLRGMFAFVLRDGERRRTLLVRDRLGVKPLYYLRSPAGGTLRFASEIKALFADPHVPRALNAGRLSEYFAFRSIVGEETLFEGVRELEPGTLMVVEDGRCSVRSYWSPESAVGATAADIAGGGRELLVDAVRARLVSDVALGTITSGGLDSSLVSAIAAEVAGEAIDTFCVGFSDPAYDERPFARAVAERIDSRHHEIVVSPEDLVRELDRLTWAHDEPLTHPNSIPMHLLFREAKERQHVTVLLSGEGADEVFGGYEWYSVAHRRASLRRVPGLPTLARWLPGRRFATLRRVLHPDYLLVSNAVSRPSEVAALCAGDPVATRRERWPRDAGEEGLFVYDQRTYLAPLLQRQDRMSMAAGLEARVPFLDHALVEWANALPMRTKLPGGSRKALLKALAARWLPESIVHRKKVGFAMPLGAWMRGGGPLARRVDELRDPQAFVQGVARAGAVDALVREHAAGADRTDLLWSLLALERWASVFLGPALRTEELPGRNTGLVRAVSSPS
ncbi:MAG TPA: asparagine synthase (glutamine-hydrolyzing) [Longimicrobiaceae bacterium]|nr:asparagine synthase (glutamine-hydrolyzing) [Longimicrobiaceae bacterium]